MFSLDVDIFNEYGIILAEAIEMRVSTKLLKYILAVAACIGITVSAIIFRCEVYRILPLYASLVVMFLQMRASRLSFLIGGCNAAYYAVVYFYLDIFGMGLYSLLVACPIQIFTYIRWKKHAYAHSTVLKRLSNRDRLVWVATFVAVWVFLFLILRSIGSEYIILDNSAAVIGVASNLASLLCLIEFPYIQSVSLFLNIFLNIQMINNDPKQWTFLIYYIYALSCAITSAFYMQKLYNKQKIEPIS